MIQKTSTFFIPNYKMTIFFIQVCDSCIRKRWGQKQINYVFCLFLQPFILYCPFLLFLVLHLSFFFLKKIKISSFAPISKKQKYINIFILNGQSKLPINQGVGVKTLFKFSKFIQNKISIDRINLFYLLPYKYLFQLKVAQSVARWTLCRHQSN